VTADQAAMFGWHAVLPIVGFVMVMSVWLLGMAMLREITR
jgi:hypothetical protein